MMRNAELKIKIPGILSSATMYDEIPNSRHSVKTNNTSKRNSLEVTLLSSSEWMS